MFKLSVVTVLAGGLILFSPTLRAEERDADAEAKEQTKAMDDSNLLTICGKIELIPVDDDKKPTKVTGTITAGKDVYVIKLSDPKQREALASFDKKETCLSGYATDGGPTGKIIYFESIVLNTARGVGRKKRGGF